MEDNIDEVIIDSMIDDLFEDAYVPMLTKDFWEGVFPNGTNFNIFQGEIENFFNNRANKTILLGNQNFRECIHNSDGFEQVKAEFIRML